MKVYVRCKNNAPNSKIYILKFLCRSFIFVVPIFHICFCSTNFSQSIFEFRIKNMRETFWYLNERKNFYLFC